MQEKNKSIPYRIIGAYDSETTNLSDGLDKAAFPILHQLGLIDKPIDAINTDNVEHNTRLYMYRQTSELYAAFDRIVNMTLPYVPVVCCHNLAFDMYGLAPWFSDYDVKVLAKSQRKPISFTILDDAGNPRLVLWDTLIFSQKSLAYMGEECGYHKLIGDWDYDLIRTPNTPLNELEIAYAAHDIYTLLAWLGYWCRLNPDINPADLGLKVVSKTGIVRKRRVQRFSKVKDVNSKKSVGQFWSFINVQNMFSTNDELYTCQASMRGGFTFCARENASRVFDYKKEDHKKIYGFDATSQHPSQMVCHRYPVRFVKTSAKNLTQAFECIEMISTDDVLNHYEKPFGVAFYGAFNFTNLRLKANTPFSKFGIAPLTWARCKTYERNEIIAEENEQGEEFKEHMSSLGYRDCVEDPIYSFGKLEGAKKATLWITELSAWEIVQAYDYDSVEALSGYITMSFDKPSDMCLISVMQFYSAKNAFKKARENYYNNEPISNVKDLLTYNIPTFVVEGMQNHSIDDSIVESTYLGLKADLNALFGIEACNEYRRDTILNSYGIEYTGDFGVSNAPNQPKAWYQFGQRIVGWSRIAQILVIQLSFPYVETIINGDTDSIKFVIQNKNIKKIERELKKFHKAINIAKKDVCSRVARKYPNLYSSLDGIGYYILEFSCFRFCASWNKAYCISEYDKRDKKEHVKFTLAGVPTSNINKLADKLIDNGCSFKYICDIFLGYNVTYAHDITGLNARSFPEWGSMFIDNVTDYLGHSTKVMQPAALCLYPMSKTINDTQNIENAENFNHAFKNNSEVNFEPLIINKNGVVKVSDLINAI